MCVTIKVYKIIKVFKCQKKLTSSITVANRFACPAAGPHGPKVGVIGYLTGLIPAKCLIRSTLSLTLY